MHPALRLVACTVASALLLPALACAPVVGEGEGPLADVTVDIAAWNLRFFPSTAGSVARAVEVIDEEDWDVVGVVELFGDGCVDALLAGLPGFDAELAAVPDETALVTGVVWNTATMTRLAGGPVTALAAALDRTPTEVVLHIEGSDVDVRFLTVHLASGIEAAPEAQRIREVAAVEAWARDFVDDGEHVVIMGDYNTAPSDARYDEVLAPFSGDADRWSVLSRDLQQPADATFLPASVILDQAVASASLVPLLDDGVVDVVHLEERYDDFEEVMSDHLPLHARVRVPGR